MFKYFASLPPQTQVALTVLASIAGILGLLLAFYQPAKDLYSQIFREKAKPRLAISLLNGSRGRMRANDRMYHPFELNEDRVITFEQQKLLAFDWNLSWNFTLRITNQTDFPAYNMKVSPFPHEEQNVSFHSTPAIDPTKAFKPHETEEFEIVCRMTYRAKSEEADEIIKNYPVKHLRIEYTNAAGDKYATVFATRETDTDKKNQYLDLTKDQA